MQREADARELFRLMHDIVKGGVPISAGIFGPFGIDRGVREDLLKNTGIICGKIGSSKLSSPEADQYFALCQVAQAADVLSKSDLDKVGDILERSV